MSMTVKIKSPAGSGQMYQNCGRPRSGQTFVTHHAHLQTLDLSEVKKPAVIGRLLQMLDLSEVKLAFIRFPRPTPTSERSNVCSRPWQPICFTTSERSNVCRKTWQPTCFTTSERSNVCKKIGCKKHALINPTKRNQTFASAPSQPQNPAIF